MIRGFSFAMQRTQPQPQTQPEAQVAMREREPSWTLAQRVAFRFVFSYFVLYMNGMIGLIPFSDAVLRKYSALWYPVVVWVGKDVLHLRQDIYRLGEIEGISNTAYGTVLFFCYLAVAALAAGVWSALDRRRQSYERLNAWFRYFLRFTLAMAMIRYGAIKILPSQMASPPPLGLLTQRLGDFSRMRLLWLFTGSSPVYESLVGCAEMLGALLLLFRRTTLLGALVCAANLTMVVILNFCFDVHVKLYSMHLLFTALLLAAPDLRRLADLLLFNRRVEPREERPLFANRRLDWFSRVLLIAFGLYAVGTGFSYAWETHDRFHPPEPPLYGVWTVEEITVNGKEASSPDDRPDDQPADPERWRTLLFQRTGALRVEKANGSWESFDLDLNPRQRRMRLGKDRHWRARFTFTEPEEDALVLDGQLDGKPARIRLSRMALTREAFHWFVDLREE
jgi:hypothetical protein